MLLLLSAESCLPSHFERLLNTTIRWFRTGMDSLVFLHVTSPVKGCTAHITSKGCLRCVNRLSVCFQAARLGKGLHTHITNIRLVTTVGHPVFLQTCGCGTGLVTYITDKGFMTCVNPLVCLQVTSIVKSLTTYTTNKWFITSVGPLVCLQGKCLGEHLTTHITNKGFIASVDPHMHLQVSSLNESLTAQVTNKGSVANVNSLVHLQAARLNKSLAAHITHKGFMTSVNPLVYSQLTSLSESLTAHVTNIGFMTCVDPLVSIQATDCSKGFGTYITHMWVGFICIYFVVISVTMIINKTVRLGWGGTRTMPHFSMGWTRVSFQTAQLNEGSGAMLTHMGCVQGQWCSRDIGGWWWLWDYCGVTVRKRLTPHRLFAACWPELMWYDSERTRTSQP